MGKTTAAIGAGSIRGLAKAVGKSQVAVARWVKDDRWPFARQGPWDAGTVERVKVWAAQTLAANPAASGGAMGSATGSAEVSGGVAGASVERQVKIKGMLERAKLTEAQRKKLEGDLVSREEMERGRVERMHAFKSALLAVPDSGVVEMMGVPPELAPEAKDILRGRLLEILHTIATAGKTG